MYGLGAVEERRWTTASSVGHQETRRMERAPCYRRVRWELGRDLGRREQGKWAKSEGLDRRQIRGLNMPIPRSSCAAVS